ncbi:SGNH/GDSL hydrolase family protein [Spirosoma aerolatum]|uniref:SGNH/GDSL hydrolase family protein n=1 Tax=Spirosoma aerolatum TaxID=1211326 RepID=UPI0009AD96F7|nr:SGNH/GDSL hydrolase family protein [Spirosoma aerolatum]
MNVLVIGDEHTYGYGLPGGKLNYIGHFIRQISRAGQTVSVEAYAHLTIPQIVATLSQLPLNRYDLIVVQLDASLLQPTGRQLGCSDTLATPILPYSSVRSKQAEGSALKNCLTSVRDGLLSFVRPKRSLIFSSLLKKLKPFRHNVLLLTPFPHLNRVDQWLQQRSRAIVLDEADDQLFSVFDTDSVIRPKEEYFVNGDDDHLNAISHEILGRSLFDFYLSAPTIVTVQSIKREE